MTEKEAHSQLDVLIPNVKLSDLDCYGGIEKELAKHIKDLTRKQWEFILSTDMAGFFQNGEWGHNWNTDRSILLQAIKNEFEKLNSWRTQAPCFDSYVAEYKSPTGVYFRIVSLRIVSYIPRSGSNGNSRCLISLINEDELNPKYTHTVVILGIDNDGGGVYIKDQCTGTLTMCEKFIENNLESGYFFKIVERK